MERHREIPSDLYGRWWKVINDEFGPIIEDDEENEVQEQPPAQQHTRTFTETTRPKVNNPERTLSNQEEENLSEYLSINMTISEARAAFEKEIESAELRQKIPKAKRAKERCSVASTSGTQIGRSTNNRGLTFN